MASMRGLALPGMWVSSDGSSWQPLDLGVEAHLGGVATGAGMSVLHVTEHHGEADHQGHRMASGQRLILREASPSNGFDGTRSVPSTTNGASRPTVVSPQPVEAVIRNRSRCA